MKKALVEMMGTFFLVLVIALTGNPLAIGAILMVMVYAGGYISGAHYNPAVTLAVFISGKIKSKEAGIYIVSQLVGAVLASLVYVFLKDTTFVVSPGPGASFAQAITVEFLFTFALASVVLHTAVSNKNTPNNFYGLAIGFTVMAAAAAGGAISGGAFNPAVGIGPLLVNAARGNEPTLNLFLLYTVGPLLGASLASFAYKYTSSFKK